MKRKPFLPILLTLALVLTIGAGAFAVGYAASTPGSPVQPLAHVISGVIPGFLPAAPPEAQEEEWELFLQVWEIVSAEFYEQPMDHAAMIRGAVRGVLETLGQPHTVLLDPSQPQAQVFSGVMPGLLHDEPPAGEEERREFFQQVWSTVSQEFYEQPQDRDAMMRGAIRGMLETLGDPHTVLLDPSISERAREQTRQKFQGIGARIEERDGQITVNQVFEKSPARKGGLKAGDVILAVDGTSIAGFSPEQAALRIRGKAGTDVVLTIKRGEEEPFDLTLTRAEIDIPSLSMEMLQGNVGYIRLWGFGALTAEELHAKLETLAEGEAPGLILDLRDNPGGLLRSAISVTSEFLAPRTVVLYEEQANQQRPYRADRGGVALDIPLVVLVNERSASASEIVAGALAHYERAVIIGQRTFGKGTVQLPHDLSDGSQLRVTIARWLTPGRESISNVGITPDIEMEADITDSLEEDAAVQRALEELQQLAALPAAA